MTEEPAARARPRRFGRQNLARMGRLFRDERQARGLSLRALAEASGMSAGAIRALEAGQANPSLSTVLAVVEALGIDLDRAVDAARGGRTPVIVQRAGDDTSAALPGAALSLSKRKLPAESVGPACTLGDRHPSMALVLEGPALAVVHGGARHRLETGDVYHAQPGVVQGLAGAGMRPARLLQVVDTRRGADPAPDRGETER